MIIFDTETTGLTVPDIPEALDRQPKIIEFAAIKVNNSLQEVDRLDFLCNPQEKLTPTIVKVTGINDSMLLEKMPFKYHYQQVHDFFQGEDEMIAHNVMFDYHVMKAEMERLGKYDEFPWPEKKTCTVEQTFHFFNKRLSLANLHLHLFGEKHKEAHRAMADVEATVRCVVELKEMGVI